MLLFIQLISKIQWKSLLSTKHLYEATEHTCMLGIARKLIIPKITEASHLSKINAYKNK
jgi:hypothetical protein